MAEDVIIGSGVRTAIGKFGGELKDIPAPKLGSIVVGEAIRRAGITAQDVDEVIMGNVISAGLGQNPARQSAIFAGVPVEKGSFTVNKVCGSGLKAVMLAAQAIRAGDAEIIVAGGTENMSDAPHLIRGLRWGMKFGDVQTKDAMLIDGLWDVYNDYHMGMTGERVAQKYNITRREADEYAFMSNERAFAATREGNFKEEIYPVTVHGVEVTADECIRPDTTMERLAKLPPVFQKDGVLTAGNSSKLSDGAAALVVMSAKKAQKLGVKPMARIVGYGTGGTRPEDIMEAPIPTVKNLLQKTGFTIGDIDLFEHNEAYSTASIAVSRALGIAPAKFNVRGGAVALGHPIGCSGARILVTLLFALRQLDKKRGLATLCLGGGNAVAMIVER